MIEERIVEVGINDASRLFVEPDSRAFPFIYRAGAQIEWDEVSRRLYSPTITDGSYLQWFERIRTAVASEYDVGLRTSDATRWSSLPEPSRSQLRTAASATG